MGAVLGVLLAIGGVRLLISLAERYSPRASEIRLDGVVLGFTLALSVALALLLSFLASLPKEGTFASWISAGARRMSGSLRKQRLQRGLVVAQIAVSVVLLAGAGLLTRTMIRLSDVNTGLRTEEVLTMEVPLHRLRQRRTPEADVDAKERYERMQRRDRGASRRHRGRSRLHHAAPELGQIQLEVKAEGKTLAVGEAMPRAEYRTADPEYFRAAGIPLLEGRAFAATDRDGLGQGRDHQPDAGRPVLPRRGPDRQADRVDRRRAALHARSAATGARSSAWSAIRRTAGWMRSRGRWCSCRSRRSSRSAAGW